MYGIHGIYGIYGIHGMYGVYGLPECELLVRVAGVVLLKRHGEGCRFVRIARRFLHCRHRLGGGRGESG